MYDQANYVDKTVLSTPEPAACSTAQKKKISRPVPKKMDEMYHMDSDDSLGIISIKSEDLIGNDLAAPGLDVSSHLQKQRQLANNSLQRANRLSGLPSRYLRPSDISKQLSEAHLNVSNCSTISESDLFKSGKGFSGNSSTPRSSIASNKDNDMNPRYSLGKSLADLSEKIKNTDIPLDSCGPAFSKMLQSVIIEEDSNMFTPAEQAEDKLLADEMSWRRANDIPGQTSMSFADKSLSMKMSMGEFFRMKSESIGDLDIPTVSPEKKAPPVPLINSSISRESQSEEDTLEAVKDQVSDHNIKHSLSVEEVAHMLAQSDLNQQVASDCPGAKDSLTISQIAKFFEQSQTPTKLMNQFFEKAYKEKDRKSTNPLKFTSEKVLRESEQIPTKLSDSFDKPLANPVDSGFTCSFKSGDIKSFRNDSPNSSSEIESILQYESNSEANSRGRYNKENIQDNANTYSASRKSPLDYANRSVTSLRSTSSLSNLVNGKLPIDASESELIWGCVKIGKSVSRNVVIRNKSQNRLRMQCSVSGPSYKILKDRPESEYVSIAKYVLQPGESKSITVSFSPIQIGAAIDAINFSPVDTNLHQTKQQRICLSGYGGHGNVEINNITKDITGKYWLCLGQLDNSMEITESFVVQNNGTLPAFGCTSFESKGMYSFTNLKISPAEFVLLPQEQRQISVSYIRSSNDWKYIQNVANTPVIEMGILKLISGTEVIRGRLRRLNKLAEEKGLPVPPLSLNISREIPGEIMPKDIHLFKESLSSVNDLLQELSTKEIVVTLEQDPELTLVAQFPNDTILFQTLSTEASIMSENFNEHLFKLEPSCIIIMPPLKMEDTFLLSSEFGEEMSFEVNIEPRGLEFGPKKGKIKQGKPVLINIKYSSNCKDNVYKVIVSLSGCILESTVKILDLAS